MDNAYQDGLFLFNWGVFDPICFELPGEALVQPNVSLGIRGLLGVGESSQEVGHCNRPPCLRNRLLLRDGFGDLRLGGYRCDGWMDLRDQN